VVLIVRHNIKTLLLLILVVVPAVCCIASVPNCHKSTLSKQLGWVEQRNSYNLCNGYFKEAPIIYIPNPRITSQSDNYNIHADHVVFPLKKGPYKFKGNVIVTQINRQLTSDFAYAYLNPNTRKIATIKIMGHVRMRALNKLVLAKQAVFDVKKKIITLYNVHYRITRGNTKIIIVKDPHTGKTERRIYQLSAHGSAKQVQHCGNITTLQDATYSTCRPDCNTWVLKGSKIKLDSAKGRGKAWNARLYVQNIPIFYCPYFSFAIDRKRHTGFLTPSFGVSSHKGFSFATPFYWNMAPNYDATITPNFMQKRGVLWQGVFRYLIPHSNGQVGFGYLPSDREFKKFKIANPLAQGNDDRKNFFFKNITNLNKNLSATVDYNYISDDYFIHDLGDSLVNNSDNQLLRQAKINYVNDIWSFLGNLQSYQTLHPVDKSDVSNQYARLPQLVLNANLPSYPLGLHFGFNSEFTRFTFEQNPYPDTTHILGVSTRSSFRPFVSLPLNWSFAYIIPRTQLQLTSYHLQNPQFGFDKSQNVAIPIFDIKSGMYFDRSIKLFHHPYQQTLEPVIYYLYVPYHNQNDIPYFDTSIQTFDYNFMFLDNRFSGIDRIGDANQTTLGVTSRFIDQNTGDEKASVSVGRIYYFRKRHVTLYYGNNPTLNADDQRYVSPITALGTYSFNRNWSANAKLTWSSATKSFDNRDVGFQYRYDTRHIINVDYNYQKQGDQIAGLPANSPENDLKQTNIAGYWQINKHWGIMGRWNYNWSHRYNQAFMYGLSYDSCCWAVRFVCARTFVALGPAPDWRKQFDNAFYVEVALKGLGTLANIDTTDFLTQSIAGYTDVFEQESRL
jgi:LPS-assembly protein